MSTTEWTGDEQISAVPIIQYCKIRCFCAQAEEYSITKKRLTIVKKEGFCCFQSMEEDNTLRENIADVDIKTVAPGWMALCCGASTDTVMVKTNAGSGKETKELKLPGGQGKVVKHILVRE